MGRMTKPHRFTDRDIEKLLELREKINGLFEMTFCLASESTIFYCANS